MFDPSIVTASSAASIIYESRRKESAEATWLSEERALAWGRLKEATNEFELAKANSIIAYLQWRYEQAGL